MSKGTVRFPESAIVDGRIGTSRIASTVAEAAARLRSAYVDPFVEPLDPTIAQLTGRLKPLPGPAFVIRESTVRADASPIERMQQLGRLPRGRMNKTEAAYEFEVLKPQLHAGEILFYRFEAIKLRLADNTFITIDFPVINAAGQLEFREVKGRWTDDARAKTKIAAAQYPFRFIAIHRVGRHGWRSEDLTSRSW
ncbi:hypothetical protein [Paraburkholderia aromaticivorans]|uniref:hypothetical protein n=1 Tax=Paraburkholderia aromaticivorans TaxID=2026199 RepID=UPI001F0EDEDC|nr:hypothetical protein [Paraburkholderia aromaticivorans]